MCLPGHFRTGKNWIQHKGLSHAVSLTFSMVQPENNS